MSSFDPAELQKLDASFDEESEIIELDTDDLRRIVDAESKRRCNGLKLASRIIALATASSDELSDDDVLRSMSDTMQRLAALRQVALVVVGADRNSADFPSVFNAVTNAMLDVVTEEWKWGRLVQGEVKRLQPGMIAKLLDLAIRSQPERFDFETAGVEISTARRLCIFEAMPKVYGLMNLFDYYQAVPEVMLARLLRAISEQAEHHASQMASDSSTFASQAILQRMYKVSVGLMCEIYKLQAFRDVSKLKEMSALDRSILIAQYEHLGGMKFDHVLEEHKAAMDRMNDTADLIVGLRN